MSGALKLDAVRLEAGLLFARHGAWPFAAVGLGVLVLVISVLIPQLLSVRDKARADTARIALELAALQATPESERQSPAQGLARSLSDQAATNAQIRKLQEFANGMGLQVMQTDYRRLSGAQQNYSELQIALPVKGNYPALRLFILTVLSEMPSLSLEQLIIKREQGNAESVDAQVYLSLWQRPTPVMQANSGANRGGAR